MTERIGIEISAKELTGQAAAAVVRNLDSMRGAMDAVARSSRDLGGSGQRTLDVFKGAGLANAVEAGVRSLMAYHDEVKKSVGAMADQADALGISTDRLQAYMFAASNVGVSQEQMTSTLSRFNTKIGEANGGNKAAIEALDRLGVKILDVNGRLRDEGTILAEVSRALLAMNEGAERAAAAKTLLGLAGARATPLLREFARGASELEANAKGAGVVIDKDLIEATNRLNNQMSSTGLAVKRFYAEIGMPIELASLRAVESLVGGIADRYARAKREQKEFLDQLPNRQAAREEGDLDKRIANLDRSIGSTPQNHFTHPQMVAARADLIRQRDATIAARQALERAQGQDLVNTANQQRLTGDGLPATGGGVRNPTPTKTGAGGDKRDRIQEGINQLQLETRAAQEALVRMQQGAQMPLKELERTVALEKKIADEIAKLGKYDPKDPRVLQIRDQVIAHEQAESKLRAYTAASKEATEIEKRLGDGTAFLAIEQNRLNEAYATGRLTLDAYNVAQKEAQDKAGDLNRRARGEQGGATGVMAGMEQAAVDWQRQHTAFRTGQQVLNDGFQLLKTTTDDWARTGVLNIQSFGQAMLGMIANVGMALAQSALLDLLKGGSGGGGGGGAGFLGGLLGGGVSGTAPGMLDGLFTSMMGSPFGFADGGRPPVGRASMIGERGPELWVPDTAGTIIPNERLGGGGGIVVNIPMTNQFGSVVSRAEMEQQLMMVEERARKGAVAGVLDAKSRGGAYRNGLRR